MEQHKYDFYALKVDGDDYSFFNTADDALENLKMLMDENEHESYGIDTVHGIWDLTYRLGGIEHHYDSQMEEALRQVIDMVEDQNKAKNKLQNKDKNSQTKKVE